MGCGCSSENKKWKISFKKKLDQRKMDSTKMDGKLDLIKIHSRYKKLHKRGKINGKMFFSKKI